MNTVYIFLFTTKTQHTNRCTYVNLSLKPFNKKRAFIKGF